MGKYFGTDGIRGVANVDLTVEMAYKVGRYLGYYFVNKNKNARIVLGKDTRISSDMLEHAIASGASASGANVYLMGFGPTPSIAYLTSNYDFDAGVMISASHNPFYDNGIKIFNHNGFKLEEDVQDEIEAYIDNKVDIPFACNEKIGRIYNYSEGLTLYLGYLYNSFPLDLSEFKIAIDCANGSSSYTAFNLLSSMNAQCHMMHNNPNGVNINVKCGSTHPEDLIDYMKNNDYNIGLAFDGDADRLMVVSEDGQLMNGDYIIYIIANYLKEHQNLTNNHVVTTVMANIGLYKALDALNIQYEATNVGDKYVSEVMHKKDYVVGGEQSGHIILKDYAHTGDGLLTALMILKIMKDTGKTLSALSSGLSIYPQLLVNQKVKDKNNILNDQEINDLIDKINLELNGNGRILVRPSGTEPLIRVMVEAQNDELCHKYVYEVIDLINKKEQ